MEYKIEELLKSIFNKITTKADNDRAKNHYYTEIAAFKPCLICKLAGHRTIHCKKEISKHLLNQWIHRDQLCKKCFENDHQTRECADGNCKLCSKEHNEKICIAERQEATYKQKFHGNHKFHRPNYQGRWSSRERQFHQNNFRQNDQDQRWRREHSSRENSRERQYVPNVTYHPNQTTEHKQVKWQKSQVPDRDAKKHYAKSPMPNTQVNQNKKEWRSQKTFSRESQREGGPPSWKNNYSRRPTHNVNLLAEQETQNSENDQSDEEESTTESSNHFFR